MTDTSSLERAAQICLPDLPDDILFLLIKYLTAWDVANCQNVSKRWRETFLQQSFLREVLKKYPKSREVRLLLGEKDKDHNFDWRQPFLRVAHRYHNFKLGQARKVETYALHPSEQYDHWHPVGQWDYHESQPGGRLYYEYAASHLSRLGNKPYLFRATLWSYDDGLVVCALTETEESSPNTVEKHILSILDVGTGKASTIPFEVNGKVIRNLRLQSRTLVIEWAEREAFHALNDSEKVNRHFGTCYDIVNSDAGDGMWQAKFRNEWKLHFLGMPLNFSDRFFSTHNKQHYAVYFWQPNRSMYTGDEDMPIEALFVWDISISSDYLPSLDPGGRERPPEDERPHPITVFSFRDLEFLGIRQHSDVSLMSIHLDSETCSLSFRENVCVAGQGYFDPAERLMRTTTTMFPFRGSGAANKQQWHGNLPPYRGHCSMESADVEESEKWFLPVMDVHDAAADVRFSLVETCFTGLSSDNNLMVRIKSLDEWVALEDKLTAEIGRMGRIAGDERWLVGQNERNELVVLKF